MQAIFVLERPAKKKGGDRYHTVLPNSEEWTIYIPQLISRPEGSPLSGFTLSIEPLDEGKEPTS